MRFVLVHGGLVAAWQWDLLIPELEKLGHDTLAPDLPGHGSRRDELASLAGYQHAIADVLEPGDVLVGHSMAGAIIALAADQVGSKIAHLVWLAATLPGEGMTIEDNQPSGTSLPGIAGNDERFWVSDPVAAAEFFWHDAAPDVQSWAFEHMESQLSAPRRTPIHLKNFWSSDIPRSYIACTADRSWPLQATEKTIARLGLSTVYPMWSSHSPFLSRPADLAALLDSIVSQS